jgi:hypothetical protein
VLVFGFLSPFGAPAFASGSSCPAEELALPHGRVTGHATSRVGPQRGFHVPHTRDTTGEDAPYTPTTTVFLQPKFGPSAAARRLPTARLLPPRYCSHPARLGVTTHHQGFTGVRPSGLPLTCSPQDGTGTLGLEPFSFAPRRYQRRTSGWGQATEHWPGTTPSTSSTSNLCVHS